MSVTPIVSLDEAQGQLNNYDAADADEIMGYILAATEIVNNQLGYSVPTTFVDTVTGRADASGRRTIILPNTPVMSVQSITPLLSGTPTVDITAVVIDADSGELSLSNWYQFYGPLSVAYTAGRSEIPPAASTACLLIVQSLWRSQRGGAVAVPGMGDDMTGQASDMLPAGALQLLELTPETNPPGIA